MIEINIITVFVYGPAYVEPVRRTPVLIIVIWIGSHRQVAVLLCLVIAITERRTPVELDI